MKKNRKYEPWWFTKLVMIRSDSFTICVSSFCVCSFFSLCNHKLHFYVDVHACMLRLSFCHFCSLKCNCFTFRPGVVILIIFWGMNGIHKYPCTLHAPGNRLPVIMFLQTFHPNSIKISLSELSYCEKFRVYNLLHRPFRF